MAEARFTVIRVGESVWSTWEPENGRFELDWLQPVLDGAHERGISVVLGTPTYAVPPWLARQYPEIAAEDATGRRAAWGARQEVDFTHPASRFHAERVIRAIAARYAAHPAVIGFQVDNEPGPRLPHLRAVLPERVRGGAPGTDPARPSVARPAWRTPGIGTGAAAELHPVLIAPRAVRGGRRDARLARRLRGGGRPSRPRSPHRLRRP
ncbi:beta-galactosidase [Streptomyces coeruleorubidus]|uniref:beta-galactosidase n=1 Tax=Streptomyces coeruleorubidus TaxID=116188 RepID=UPI003F4B6CBC